MRLQGRNGEYERQEVLRGKEIACPGDKSIKSSRIKEKKRLGQKKARLDDEEEDQRRERKNEKEKKKKGSDMRKHSKTMSESQKGINLSGI